MRRPSKTLVKRLIFMVMTTFIFSVVTSLFLGEVLHMRWGPRRDVLLAQLTASCWMMLRIWLHQKSKNDAPADPGAGGD
jgi:hypothetical protein